ncbi:MAG: hypothetical protein HND56_01185 [Pseudomonadota bacterium]|nr:hypothetical protein [Pseudomonadota bacterium]QKK04378.1 MAG: hypothetical protein HND56_01185 [Pseudomonadota bacterium]
MTAQWPSALPESPLTEAYAEALPDNIIRSSTDQGPAKLRRRTTAGVRHLQLAYILSAAQTELLDGFYLEDLQSGSLPFLQSHPRTGEEKSMRFKSPPDYTSLNGGYFRVTLELEILP